MPDTNGVGCAFANGGFSEANETWLPIADTHLERAGLQEAERPHSIDNELASFLAWRKTQPAMMSSNHVRHFR